MAYLLIASITGILLYNRLLQPKRIYQRKKRKDLRQIYDYPVGMGEIKAAGNLTQDRKDISNYINISTDLNAVREKIGRKMQGSRRLLRDAIFNSHIRRYPQFISRPPNTQAFTANMLSGWYVDALTKEKDPRPLVNRDVAYVYY